MAAPPRLPLTETSPGVYETFYTLLPDVDPGIYDAVATFTQAGGISSVTPAAVFMVLAAAPAAPPVPMPANVAPSQPGGIAPPPPPPPPPAQVILQNWVPPNWGGQANRAIPAGELWVTPDDVLVIGLRCSQPSAAVTVVVRMWDPNGGYAGGAITITPPADRTRHFTAMPLTFGYLVAVSVQNAGNSMKRGQLHASLRVARGPLASFTTHWWLAADYVTWDHEVGWPPGRIVSSLEGPGWLSSIAVGTPAAGQEWALTTVSGARWKIRGITAFYNIANAGVNRSPGLMVRSALAVPTLYIVDPLTYAPNTFANQWWTPGLAAAVLGVAGGGDHSIPMPDDLVLDFPWDIRSFTRGMNAADQYSSIEAIVEEWLDDF
jgi:hypothetical protein